MPHENWKLTEEMRRRSRLAQRAYRERKNANRPPRVEPELKLSPTEAAYIAGFFDGEGCVVIARQSTKGPLRHRVNPEYTLLIKISNSDKPVLDWIAALVGGFVAEQKVPSKRRHWYFSLKSNNAKRLLQAMLPFLTVKREQAIQAIEFQERNSAHKNRYEAGRVGPVPRTTSEIAYKEHYFRLLQQMKRPQET